jgi:branched-chain amino acid transport system substrate-binding protein
MHAVTTGLALLVCVTTAACSSDRVSEPAPRAERIAKIGVIAPLTGDLAPVGLGIRNSADLAVRLANQANTVPGWTLQLVPEDDAATPEVGARAASELSSDSAVVGVVGTYNSGVAMEVAPILDLAHVAEVSPGNTNDRLTRGDNFATAPVRPHSNYFRVCTVDSLQGAFAADYAFNTVGARQIVVVHDGKAYGKGLAELFRDRFVHDGGTVLAVETINPGDKDFSGLVSRIAPLHPDLIFYGGEFPEAGLISRQAKEAGVAAPLMGGDGIEDDAYVALAGAAGEGDYAVSIGAPPELLASAGPFVDAYRAAGYKEGYSGFGALSFDATNTIIRALARVLPGRVTLDDEARRMVINAVAASNFDGITGKVAFDSFGDAVTRSLTVFRVKGGRFEPEASREFTQ